MVAPLATWTFGDVMSYVRRQFGDEDNVQINDSDLIRWTNQGQQVINSKDPMIQAISTYTTTGLEGYIDLPDDLMQLDILTWDGLPLKPTNPADGMDQAGLLGSGGSNPQLFYTYGPGIYLIPQPNEAGHVVTIFYYARPQGVATAADHLGIPDRYFEELCQYVMTKAYELDQDWQAQQVTNAAFQAGMSEKSMSSRNVIGANLSIREADSDDDYYYEAY